MLTKDQILAANDRNVGKINVPEWGGEVGLAVMSGADRDEFISFAMSKNLDEGGDAKEIQASLLSLCLTDANGERLFSKDDVAALNEKNGSVISRLFRIAQEKNALTPEAKEWLEKN